ncbi:unnamed protein product [Alternaria alternata]|nr:hypothetical protein AALT_g7224 [Alternaria alternata]RYN63681.1 hypothetical protein AA0118_g4547 [Alternaria tenuissima]RYN95064.1 hypothetical protein AA0120_g3833 [Alternaria tenuissima]
MNLLGSFSIAFLGFFSVAFAATHPRDFPHTTRSVLTKNDKCYINPNICAEVMIGDKINQQLGYDGCQRILNPDKVTGIKMLNCECNLYYSVDSGSCNSGVDETIDRLGRCDIVTGKERRWKKQPNFWSCHNPPV